jgi:hypothetical protein
MKCPICKEGDITIYYDGTSIKYVEWYVTEIDSEGNPYHGDIYDMDWEDSGSSKLYCINTDCAGAKYGFEAGSEDVTSIKEYNDRLESPTGS